MSRLFTMAVVRDPKPRPRASTWPIIPSHPAASAPPEAKQTDTKGSPRKKGEETEGISVRLQAAWAAQDWSALAELARAHLSASSPQPEMHPYSISAITFFKPDGTVVGAAETEAFLAEFSADELKSYLREPLEKDRLRLADDALALHCLGLLGSASFDYVGALRGLNTFKAVCDLGLAERSPRTLSTDFIEAQICTDIALPEWSFDIEVCRRSDDRKGWPSESPIERKIQRLRAKAQPSARVSCDCAPLEAVCSPQDPCCGEVRYFVADLLELRDWTHRYKAGDLAFIENVAAGETRSREHKMKQTRELFSETETSESRSEKRDFQVADRSSLQREIERQKEASIGAEASASVSYDAKPYTASLSATARFSRSSSEAIREAQESSVETVKSAVSEIEKKVRSKRSERVTIQETEKNLHAFANKGATPLVTKYFWVTQERRAQLFSYGKQLIAEFIVPSPARLFEKLMVERREALINERIKVPTIEEPDAVDALAFTAAEITRDGYVQLCANHGVVGAPSPPLASTMVSVTGSDQTNRGDGEHVTDLAFQVPDGFRAVSMSLSGSQDPEWRRPKADPHKVVFTCAGDTLYWSKEQGHKLQSSLGSLTGSQNIGVDAWHTDYFTAVVTITCTVLPSVEAAWRDEVFQMINDQHEAALATYSQALAAYNAAMAEYEAKKDDLRQDLIGQDGARHPFFNREFERTELKRAVIYLLCQDFSVEGAVIRKAEPCGFPEIDRSGAAAKGYDWYFWDRLIDWKQMAYAFFDYFWNPICDWPQRVDPDEPDALFKAFRRAGYARVLVPISPTMHEDFLWYVSTHQKWGQSGQPPLNAEDSRWRNVVFELKHAQASAMTSREGHADVTLGASDILVKGSDRYWNSAGSGAVDTAMTALDIDREFIIDGTTYLITGITLDSGSPAYDSDQPNGMWWRFSLDRPYEGPSGIGRLYALGAQAVAPIFSFDMPTELVWAGAHDSCLPTYPLPPCEH